MSDAEPRFDWYSCTLDTMEPDRIVGGLAVVLGAEVRQVRGALGYGVAWELHQGEDLLVKVFGRGSRLGEVHIQVIGDACDRAVPVLRSLWPEHRVARADVAIDLEAVFNDLDAVVLDFAKERGLKFRLVEDSDGGATRYLGSRKSEYSMRLYKKSEQLRAKGCADVPDGIVRLEVEVKPGKRTVKEALAALRPADVFGFSRWGTDLVEAVLGLSVVRTRTHFRKPTNWAAFLANFVAVQVGPGVRGRVAEVGKEQAVSELLEALGV